MTREMVKGRLGITWCRTKVRHLVTLSKAEKDRWPELDGLLKLLLSILIMNARKCGLPPTENGYNGRLTKGGLETIGNHNPHKNSKNMQIWPPLKFEHSWYKCQKLLPLPSGLIMH